MDDIANALEPLERSGWCWIQDQGRSLLEVGESLGAPTSSRGRPLVQSLAARSRDLAPSNSMSGLFGRAAFPLHTDAAHWHVPPRYVLLRHAAGTKAVPTFLVDTRNFLTGDLRQRCRLAVWRASRIRSQFLCSVLFTAHGIEGFRWDPCCLFPHGTRAIALHTELLDAMRDAACRFGETASWHVPEAILAIDNWRVIHGRPEVPSSVGHRELERVLVAQKGF
jgi:L-asparagine oxygenase